MKRRCLIRWILGLLVALFLPVLPVSAVGNTVLKTSVPNSVMLSLEITGKGVVWIGSQKYSDSQSVAIPRNEETVISFQSATGYRLSSVKLNSIDISQKIDDNSLTIDNPNQNMTLSVVFLRNSAIWPGMNPPTGDYHIGIVFWLSIFSLVSLLLLLLIKNRKMI